MAKHIWFNPGRFADLQEADCVGGLSIVVELSPYDTPKGVTGIYDESKHQFMIDFNYIDRESSVPVTVDFGIQVLEGRHSGKLMGIRIPLDQEPHQSIAVIELQTKILKALENRLDSAPDQAGRRLNINAAKSVIESDLGQLVGV